MRQGTELSGASRAAATWPTQTSTDTVSTAICEPDFLPAHNQDAFVRVTGPIHCVAVCCREPFPRRPDVAEEEPHPLSLNLSLVGNKQGL